MKVGLGGAWWLTDSKVDICPGVLKLFVVELGAEREVFGLCSPS